MIIKIKEEQAKILGTALLSQFGLDKYDIENNKVNTINLGDFKVEKIRTLQTQILMEKQVKKFSYIIRMISKYLAILDDKGENEISSLQEFRTAFVVFMQKFKGHKLYEKRDDIFLCYRVTNAVYEPPTLYDSANVTITMIHKLFGQVTETRRRWYTDSVVGKRVNQILLEKNLFAETEELRKSYLKDIEKFVPMTKETGVQYIANGLSDNSIDDILEEEDDDNFGNRRRNKYETKTFRLNNSKVVIDVFSEKKIDDEIEEDDDYSSKISIGETFWSNPLGSEYSKSKKDRRYVEDVEHNEEDIELDIEIPIHPYLVIFDLFKHKRLTIHYSYLKKYIYDENMSDKLVLGNDIKTLIQSLIEHKSGGFSDIIHGKTGGVIILLSGRAGVGKTLTAEVYAESKKRPLYNVQASQLGFNVKELERRLMKILKRASRWDAILLIDEADVYVRERGDDLQQNGIVGVFLRILEYHSSMLFMTTNRPDTVDDAIMSRCIARIDYVYPTKDEQKKIWGILADTSKIKLDPQVIDKFVEKYHEYSGRDIKNLLKLGHYKAISENSEITFEILDYVTRFNPTLVKKK